MRRIIMKYDFIELWLHNQFFLDRSTTKWPIELAGTGSDTFVVSNLS